jgi:O-antigen/teichoic acid export membrane protein
MPNSAPEQKHAERFFIHILWNWLSVAANLLVGFTLTRFLIRSLTDEQYGVWVLTFSLAEYATLFDLGFRSATVNFVSRFRVQKDTQGMSEAISTSLAYFLGIAALCLLIAFALANQGYRLFHISPSNRSDFAFLLTVVGFMWAGSFISVLFQASLEAFQAFKIANKIVVGTLLVRSICCVIVLYLGYGLRALGICTLIAQFAGWIMIYLAFRQVLPEIKIGRRFVRSARWKEMAKYGLNSVYANVGGLFLNQGPPLVVGHYLPATFVGFYGLPFRLLNYMVDLITRIGYVTAPKTAELAALGHRAQIGRLGTRLNRYCFALFLPPTIFLSFYAQPLLMKWLGRAEFVNQSAPLLPVFALSVSFAVSAQFNSSSILYGLAKHGPFAISLLAESGLAIVGMALVLPHYGIFGAACLCSGLAIVNRGFITPFLVCRALPYNYLHYMGSIYVRPLLCAVPVIGLAILFRASWLPGQTIGQLVVAGATLFAVSLLLSLKFCVEREHRALLWNTLRQRLAKESTSVPKPDPQYT